MPWCWAKITAINGYVCLKVLAFFLSPVQVVFTLSKHLAVNPVLVPVSEVCWFDSSGIILLKNHIASVQNPLDAGKGTNTNK